MRALLTISLYELYRLLDVAHNLCSATATATKLFYPNEKLSLQHYLLGTWHSPTCKPAMAAMAYRACPKLVLHM